MRRFRRDAGLSLRIVLSLAGLIVLYVPLLAWVAGIGWFVAGFAGVVVVAALVVVLPLLPLGGGRDAVRGATPLEPRDAPDVHGALERLCALADLPVPRLALLDVPYPNAFTVARTPTVSTLVVTRGLLDRLDPPELEAVLAHELAHLAHRDAFVMTIVSVPARALRAVVLMLSRPARAPELWLLLVVLLPVVALAWCADAIATMLVLTLSRYRELIADRGAALLTGRPEALMSALQKISARLPSIPVVDLREAAAWNPFFVLPTERPPGVFELDPFVLFPTHPPLQRRLEQLAALQRATPPLQVEVPSRAANPRAGLSLRLAFVTWPLAWGAYLLGGGAPIVSLLAMATWILSFVFAVQAIGVAQRGAAGGRLAAASLVVLAAPVLVTIVLGSALALAGG
jgi:heat shock protein HtpX